MKLLKTFWNFVKSVFIGGYNCKYHINKSNPKLISYIKQGCPKELEETVLE